MGIGQTIKMALSVISLACKASRTVTSDSSWCVMRVLNCGGE